MKTFQLKKIIKEEIKKLQEQPAESYNFYICGEDGEFTTISISYDEWTGGLGSWNALGGDFLTSQGGDTWCDSSGDGSTYSATTGGPNMINNGSPACSTVVGGGYANVISDPSAWNVNPDIPGVGGSPQISSNAFQDMLGNIVWVAYGNYWANNLADLQETACFACNGTTNPDCPNYIQPIKYACDTCNGCQEDPNGPFDTLDDCQKSGCTPSNIDTFPFSSSPGGFNSKEEFCARCEAAYEMTQSWAQQNGLPNCDCCSSSAGMPSPDPTRIPSREPLKNPVKDRMQKLAGLKKRG